MNKIILFISLLFTITTVSQTTTKDKTVPQNQTSREQPIIGIETDPNPYDNTLIDFEPIDPVDPVVLPAEVGKTRGELSVSLTGAATYNVPIQVPPGINGIEPKLSLFYNSQGGVGLAGYGWSVNGLSSITRIPATKFHDGFNDPVDLDSNDRFALDGQRLLLKEGIYGALGSTYVTENYSNVKITLISNKTSTTSIENGITVKILGKLVFKVEYPDGSIAWYGNNSDSTFTTSGISSWENPQSIKISYHYFIDDGNDFLYPLAILYGGLGNNPSINEIQFLYKSRNTELSSLGNTPSNNDKIISQIKVLGKGIGFKSYNLTHDISSDYERLISIKENTGDGLKSLSPITFKYNENPNLNKLNFIGPNLDPSYIFPLDKDLFTWHGFPRTYRYEDFTGNGKEEFLYFRNTTTSSDKFKINFSFVDFDNNITKNFDLSFDYPWNNNDSLTRLQPNSDYSFGSNVHTIKYNTVNPNGIDYKIADKTGLLVLNTYYNYNTIPYSPVVKIRANIFKANTDGKVNILEFSKDFELPKIERHIFSGDFNGDGTTDIVSITKDDFYFIDLDRRKANNFVKKTSINNLILNYNHSLNPITSVNIKVADVNNDNKADLIHFDYGEVKIYSLDENQNFYLLSKRTNFSGYPENAKIADFNGDGNIDILLPNPKQICFGKGDGNFTDKEFIKDDSNNYIDLTGIAFNFDFDKNGKADILKIIHTKENFGNLKLELYELGSSFRWKKTTFSYSKVGDFFSLLAIRQNNNINDKVDLIFSSGFYKLPNTTTTNYPVRISAIKFNNNFQNQKLINQISINNNLENITYKKTIDNKVYSNAGQIENYPNFDLPPSNNFNIVSQINSYTSDYSFYKTQDFKYFGGVINTEGLGFLGFRSILKTNWYNDPSKIISTITKLDISKRGAQTESFSVLGATAPNLTLSPGTPFISRTQTIYNNEDTVYQNPLLANKVFNLKPTKIINTNGLEGTSTEKTFTYNTTNSPTQITTTYKNGSVTDKTETQTLTYDTITTPYMVDRLTQKNYTATVFPSGDTTSSEEIYTYNTNLLTQIKKKGDGTDYITEDNQYDTFGNIIKKTLSATNMQSRTSSFEYDLSGRFLTKKTDLDGLITNYTYDLSKGLLLTESLPSTPASNLKNTYTYDTWGKLITKTNVYGIKETYAYANTYDGGFTKTTTNEDGSYSKATYDALGREIQIENKDLNDNSSFVDKGYDSEDRLITITPPNDGNQNVWNETQYDNYGRVVQTTSLKSASSPGKTTSYSYTGTSVTENDGIKSKTTTRNSLNQVISVTETPGGTINYSYFANGNLKSTICNGATITITQDGWGRKKELNDPSAGLRKYDYNAFGELIKEEVVGQGENLYDLDPVGKLLSKTIKDAGGNLFSKSTYTYNTNKLVESIRLDDYTNNSFTTNNFTYDSYLNVLSTTEELNGKAKFSTTFTYDTFGRPLTESYTSQNLSTYKSSSRTITNTYKNGYKSKITDSATGIAIWETKTVNPQGQVLTANLGNGIAITNTYDIYGFSTQNKHDKISTNVMTLTNTFDPVRGNLLTRSNNLFGPWNETFSYDLADRLTTYKNAQGIQTQEYNTNGTIAKNSIGEYAYTIAGKPYQVSSITPVDQSSTSPVLSYYKPKIQNVTYTVFKSPLSIKVDTNEYIDFDYNTYNNRSVMYYGSLDPDKNARPYQKYYAANGVMEIKLKTTSPSSLEFLTYIGGDAYTAPAVLLSDGTTQKMYYLHRDYQGTIVAITNDTGAVVEKRLFDVWGEMINYQKGAITSIPTTTGAMLIDRGYTGHEHLLGVDIINMNGRIYDHKFHRFLQPDNNIQDPTNTQNHNRYAYVMNNPTKYTDPSGEFWEYVAAFLFSTYVHGAQATGNANPVKWNFDQWASAVSSVASPILSNYASNAATNVVNGYIMNYGQPTAAQIAYMNNNPVENHSYISNGYNYISSGYLNQETFANGIREQNRKYYYPLFGEMDNTFKAVKHSVLASDNFYGAELDLWSKNGSGNTTIFGTIHTSEAHYNTYLKNGFKIQPNGLLNSSTMLLMHEYGHFLHAKIEPFNFYSYAMWSSIATSQSDDAKNNWTEIKANTYSYYYFGQPKGWDYKEYPINPKFLSEFRKRALLKK